MKIASIVGARPNFIKLAPLSKELRRRGFDEVIIHTGQHYNYEMDKIFFDDLGIPAPDYHMGIGSGSHGLQTGEMLKKSEEVLVAEKPDLVIVFGDTNSTLAGSLAAAKLHIKSAHVEAGLRSFDRSMPEEINRVIVDHCSDLLFCPTTTAVDNLRKEGIIKGVHLTGDVMVDAQRECESIARKRSHILDDLDLKPKGYYLATVHRASNTDEPNKLRGIAEALKSLGNVVFPCHPRTEKYLKEYRLWDDLVRKIRVIKPVGYLDMLLLEKNAAKIITDSGGVQKEAYLLGTACITLRGETEWVETVEDGWNMLVGPDTDKIVTMARCFVPGHKRHDAFGKGDASIKMADLIELIAASS
ncbi:MAG: UDP-N-acetylglucosamine 2-epimerase (non-hydrolyzing) [Methanothrix sp.]|nr:UDP-N-acetylglucosamine 2-epimerase (non-hydrolyzing) [Methanothrix sp.]